jgi:hypothetical protein
VIICVYDKKKYERIKLMVGTKINGTIKAKFIKIGIPNINISFILNITKGKDILPIKEVCLSLDAIKIAITKESPEPEPPRSTN